MKKSIEPRRHEEIHFVGKPLRDFVSLWSICFILLAVTHHSDEHSRPEFVTLKMTKKASKQNGSIVNIGLTQMACSEDVKANRAKQIRLVEAAAKKGAKIISTQE